MTMDRNEIAAELYSLGRHAFEADDLQACIEYMRASAALEPHYKTMEILGESLLRLGHVRESIVWLAAAAGLSPKQVRSRLLLAEALEMRDETGKARIQLEEALRVNPQFASARSMLARMPLPEEEEGLGPLVSDVLEE
jgi:tetratricopeptide (TPR) repeat protein